MIAKQERVDALERQTNRLQRRIDILEQQSNRYSWIRLAIFLIGIGLALAGFFFVKWWLGLILAAIAITAFSIVASFQRTVDRSITRHSIWRHIKATQIARIRLDWAHIPRIPHNPNIPPVSEREVPGNHPFATDLDLIGDRSLHQLVNTAVSREGSIRLQGWLLTTQPELSTILQRQILVGELTPLSRFRTKLTMKSLLASRNSMGQLEGKQLLQWLNESKQTSPRTLRLIITGSIALTILTLILLLLNIFGLITPLWIVTVVLAIGLLLLTKDARGDILDDADFLTDAFSQLSTVFEFLETYPYGKNQHLKQLCAPFFQDSDHRPSRLLKRLARLANMALLSKNQMFWLIVNVLVPWDTYVALQLNRYKAKIAAYLPVWLDTLFELEALCSLATFACLNPNYVLPDVSAPQEHDQKIIFRASGLGHPLIPEENKVVNDFTMDHIGEVAMLTGSNMAGKSTFLRTIGINLALAYAGGPVNANSLHTLLYRIYTCIKVSDSVNDGYSYFYAEVKRLKGLLTELNIPNPLPLFFLIDEIFKGTNNRERLIGSTAYIHALIGKNCVGAISTHDLELVKLADTLPDIRNYHFREEVVDGQMVFDYILRNGPCPTTNALKIMEMEGLPV